MNISLSQVYEINGTNGLAMSSNGLTRKDYRMSRNLINNNNIRLQHLTAITYSLCCTSVKKDVYART